MAPQFTQLILLQPADFSMATLHLGHFFAIELMTRSLRTCSIIACSRLRRSSAAARPADAFCARARSIISLVSGVAQASPG